MPFGLWLTWIGAANAGSGPWVVGDGQGTLYVGAEAQHLSKLAVTIDGERNVVDVAEGLNTFGVKGIASVGLGSRFEVQALVPWYDVSVSRPDHPLCGALGLDACRATRGVGVIEARVKGLLLDEYFGAPVSLALGGELRAGHLTGATRERITNRGEGTTDLGGFLTVGRTGSLGDGFWSAWVEGGGRYRVPNTDTFPLGTGDTSAPGAELTFATQLLAGPGTRLAVGPSLYGLHRPGGLDYGQVDLTDVDRFAVLSITNLRVGGTAVVRASADLAATVSVLGTVASRNNPTDTVTVSVGLQVDRALVRASDG